MKLFCKNNLKLRDGIKLMNMNKIIKQIIFFNIIWFKS